MSKQAGAGTGREKKRPLSDFGPELHLNMIKKKNPIGTPNLIQGIIG